MKHKNIYLYKIKKMKLLNYLEVNILYRYY